MIHLNFSDWAVGAIGALTDTSPLATATPSAGWGRCRACDCRGFKDTGEDFRICAGCGHEWTEHR